MKKKRYYVIVILLISFIFIGDVKADTCINSYNNNLENNTSFTVSSNPGQIHRNVRFNNSITIDMQYDYIKIPFYIVSLSTNNIISNINLYESCTTATNVFDNYTITYQDGTQASIDAENYRTICNQYNINGTAVIPYTPYISTTNVNLYYGNSGRMICELDNNLVAKCRIPKNETSISISGYIIDTYLNNQSSTIQAGIVNGVYQLCKDSDTQIIEQQQETNNKIDEIQNSDISSESKESPNTDQYDDYQDAENSLFDKMEQADTSNLNVAIDGNSANFVWDTITRFYNSNALLMNFLISILSIGIIKMALGR